VRCGRGCLSLFGGSSSPTSMGVSCSVLQGVKSASMAGMKLFLGLRSNVSVLLITSMASSLLGRATLLIILVLARDGENLWVEEAKPRPWLCITLPTWLEGRNDAADSIRASAARTLSAGGLSLRPTIVWGVCFCLVSVFGWGERGQVKTDKNKMRVVTSVRDFCSWP